MNIDVTVKMSYWLGKSIATFPERLSITAKFKDPNKFNRLFYTKIKKDIEYSTKKYDSYDEYLDYIEKIVNDQEEIRKVIEDIVKKYFYDEYKNKTQNAKLDRIWGKINKINKEKIKITVKIDD